MLPFLLWFCGVVFNVTKYLTYAFFTRVTYNEITCILEVPETLLSIAERETRDASGPIGPIDMSQTLYRKQP